MIIKILADGGNMAPGPALSQKLGPAGIPIPQVIQRVNEATKNFKGMKVPIELDVNPSTKTFEVRVFSPPVSELVKSELKITKGSGRQGTFYVGNASIEQVISVARIKLPNLLCNNLKTAVKNVAGTCQSLGVLVENKPAKEIEEEIDSGKYDKQINEEITETPEEKKKELEEYFTKIKTQQDNLLKQEQVAKKVADEKASKKAEKVSAPAPKK
ncbi:50S ribosomal protein L11 [Candidatus Pacearchaeota archaeon]|nr:50S ribosomal protein L11 [Candidatus Pacearchaeota archaeon]